MRVQNLLLLTAAMLLTLNWYGLADEKGKQWTGYLIDRKCMKAVVHDHDPVEFVKHHTKSCLLLPICAQSGYVLYCEGKWLKLDKQGDELAGKLIRSSKRGSKFYVRVKGQEVGKEILVSEILEVEEPENK